MSAPSTDDRPVVLLHSIGTDRHLWDGVVAELGTARVLVPESRGHGREPWVDGLTVEGWVEDLDGQLDALGVGAVDLVGLSMGGVQAMAYAAAHPERVQRLVVADSFAALAPEVAASRVTTITAAVESLGMAAYADHYLRTTLVNEVDEDWRDRIRTSIAGVDAHAYLHSVHTCFRADVRKLLPGIEAECLVLVGEHDEKTPRALSEEIADSIPGARLDVVPGAGHLACVDAPESFAAAVRTFLSPETIPVLF